MSLDHPRLSPRQRELLHGWLPSAALVRDYSWRLVGTTVLEVEHELDRLLIKAGDAHDHHIARELRAHLYWLRPGHRHIERMATLFRWRAALAARLHLHWLAHDSG